VPAGRTTGLSVETSSGTEFSTAAAHCCPSGTRTYGEGDTPAGSFGDKNGRCIGSPACFSSGDGVCQDGDRSDYPGHGVPCGINVSDDAITCSLSCDGTMDWTEATDILKAFDVKLNPHT
jgi:hypothetical protein